MRTTSFLLVENLNPIPICLSHHLINNNMSLSLIYCGEISFYISVVIYVFDVYLPRYIHKETS
jgi:hypothetical protein